MCIYVWITWLFVFNCTEKLPRLNDVGPVANSETLKATKAAYL